MGSLDGRQARWEPPCAARAWPAATAVPPSQGPLCGPPAHPPKAGRGGGRRDGRALCTTRPPARCPAPARGSCMCGRRACRPASRLRRGHTRQGRDRESELRSTTRPAQTGLQPRCRRAQSWQRGRLLGARARLNASVCAGQRRTECGDGQGMRPAPALWHGAGKRVAVMDRPRGSPKPCTAQQCSEAQWGRQGPGGAPTGECWAEDGDVVLPSPVIDRVRVVDLSAQPCNHL